MSIKRGNANNRTRWTKRRGQLLLHFKTRYFAKKERGQRKGWQASMADLLRSLVIASNSSMAALLCFVRNSISSALSWSPSLRSAVRISTFCIVWTSFEIFPIRTSRSISAKRSRSWPGSRLAKRRITSGVLKASLTAERIAYDKQNKSHKQEMLYTHTHTHRVHMQYTCSTMQNNIRLKKRKGKEVVISMWRGKWVSSWR